MVLCDRRIKQPSQVWELCTFAHLPTWATVAPYRRRAETFQTLFRSYIFGSGTPETPVGQHSEEVPDPTIPAAVLRGSVLLAALTENEDLPADPDYRIQVRQFTHKHYPGLRVQVQLVFRFRGSNTYIRDSYLQWSRRRLSHTGARRPHDQPGWDRII